MSANAPTPIHQAFAVRVVPQSLWLTALAAPFLLWDSVLRDKPWPASLASLAYMYFGIALLLLLAEGWRSLKRTTRIKLGFSLAGPAVQRLRRLCVPLSVLVVILMPLLRNEYYVEVGYRTFLFMTMAVALNITLGYAGLLDLGFIAFYAIGAYSWALLASGVNGILDFQVPGWIFWLWIPVGGLISAFVRVLIGYPALRLRGDYLAIVTLGFGEITRQLLTNLRRYTGGSNGINIKTAVPIPFLPDATLKQYTYFWYFVAFAFLVLVILFCYRLERSRFGRAWLAIREDELAARAMGIPSQQYLLGAYVLSGFIAGMAGVIFAASERFVEPRYFVLDYSIWIVVMVVLGGLGSIPGVVLGALLTYALPEALRAFSEYRLIA
ncbi:MAG: branched-chain amino acid ABC transporter permease, partial [bacterium JZ-2024 1]